MSGNVEKRVITILGATGSVGISALDVISRHAEDYCVFALTAYTNIKLLIEQCERFEPNYAVIVNPAQLDAVKDRLRAIKTQVLAGSNALEQVASDKDCNTVLAAISGSAGLLPTFAAVRAGKRVLLANKEALVMGGGLFMRSVKESGATLLPVDSEHNGVFQCLNQDQNTEIKKLVLTASGGPFLDTPIEALATVTVEQACAHPTWDMGVKISVDSATMMNKGLEVIEACWLFNVSPDQVEVVIHPQSVIHAMVAFEDGSIIAQMSQPDMRIPISFALAWPKRISSGVDVLDLARCGELQLRKVDEKRFPCLPLAYRAFQMGDTAVIALNAANEIAVEAFIAGRLRFDHIVKVVQSVVESTKAQSVHSIEEIIATDSAARETVQAVMQQ